MLKIHIRPGTSESALKAKARKATILLEDNEEISILLQFRRGDMKNIKIGMVAMQKFLDMILDVDMKNGPVISMKDRTITATISSRRQSIAS